MISVTILAKNCQSTLAKTLDSVRIFDEVILLDTGSTDETQKIAARYPNTKIHTSAFKGFGTTHNIASSLASHDWILSLDSDEVLSEGLIQEILSLSLSSDTIYSFQRFNFFNGKHIKCCAGWHPDWVARLYHRKTTSFDEAPVHEKIIIKKGFKQVKLKHPVLHRPYREMRDFLDKMQHYTSLFAEQHKGKKKSSLTKAIMHGTSAFLKSYLLKRGLLGGAEGFIISMYNGQTAFYKYLKLKELNKIS